jgi:TPR repeat protein
MTNIFRVKKGRDCYERVAKKAAETAEDTNTCKNIQVTLCACVALTWCLCWQGHADAQFAYGTCFAKGRGIKKNHMLAAEWFSKAANQGHGKAAYNLALSKSCFKVPRRNQWLSSQIQRRASARHAADCQCAHDPLAYHAHSSHFVAQHSCCT